MKRTCHITVQVAQGHPVVQGAPGTAPAPSGEKPKRAARKPVRKKKKTEGAVS